MMPAADDVDFFRQCEKRRIWLNEANYAYYCNVLKFVSKWDFQFNPFPHTGNLQQTTLNKQKYGKSLQMMI